MRALLVPWQRGLGLKSPYNIIVCIVSVSPQELQDLVYTNKQHVQTHEGKILRSRRDFDNEGF